MFGIEYICKQCKDGQENKPAVLHRNSQGVLSVAGEQYENSTSEAGDATLEEDLGLSTQSRAG